MIDFSADYNRNEYLDRIEELQEAVSYSRTNEGYLSVFECMLCHQEIAQQYRALEGEQSRVQYRVPPEVGKKVSAASLQVKKTGFIRPMYYH